MPNIIGEVPEFNDAESKENQDNNVKSSDSIEAIIEGDKEVKETDTDKVSEEKETPDESSTSEKPAQKSDDGSGSAEAVTGLQKEKDKLLQEIQNLRTVRREIKQKEIPPAPQAEDKLEDIAPQDLQVLDRILKAKGVLTREEWQREEYQQIQNQELEKFLDKYREFRPENDPEDKNWNALLKEFSLYKTPADPHQVGMFLERARQVISVPSTGERDAKVNQNKIELASKGRGGVQRSSSSQSSNSNLSENEKAELLRRGGWSEEEINDLLNR